MTALELRSGIEELLNRAEVAERCLAAATEQLAEANVKVQGYATEAAVLAVRLENCRTIELEAIIRHLMHEMHLVNTHGLLLSTERVDELVKAWRAGAHRGKA